MKIHITKAQLYTLLSVKSETIFFERDKFSDNLFLVSQEVGFNQVITKVQTEGETPHNLEEISLPYNQIKALYSVIARGITIEVMVDRTLKVYTDYIESSKNTSIALVALPNDSINEYRRDLIEPLSEPLVLSTEIFSHYLKVLQSPKYNSPYVEIVEITSDCFKYISAVEVIQHHTLNFNFPKDERVVFPFSTIATILKFIKGTETIAITLSKIEDTRLLVISINDGTILLNIELSNAMSEHPVPEESELLFKLKNDVNTTTSMNHRLDLLSIPLSSNKTVPVQLSINPSAPTVEQKVRVSAFDFNHQQSTVDIGDALEDISPNAKDIFVSHQHLTSSLPLIQLRDAQISLAGGTTLKLETISDVEDKTIIYIPTETPDTLEEEEDIEEEY